jgi:hypothetical protein
VRGMRGRLIFEMFVMMRLSKRFFELFTRCLVAPFASRVLRSFSEEECIGVCEWCVAEHYVDMRVIKNS